MLAMRLFFWDDWPVPPPVTGQSPSGMKYAAKYKISYIYRCFTLIVGV